ncbi:hypothetical protein ATE48_03245 [Candidatus Viadribacter manganicus]|uniref:Uncharacterized protein n=1 Tax=Candidatus Viadribacter manganicus TaxID=1759059 RepID=A0A1B1AEM1_9PROT|nr:hypothetical protein ATE48_03245 [Candidatus Viadribacter manganicus]
MRRANAVRSPKRSLKTLKRVLEGRARRDFARHAAHSRLAPQRSETKWKIWNHVALPCAHNEEARRFRDALLLDIRP